jgi:hypothetical protein
MLPNALPLRYRTATAEDPGVSGAAADTNVGDSQNVEEDVECLI